MGKCGRRAYCYLHPQTRVKPDTLASSHSYSISSLPLSAASPGRGLYPIHSIALQWWMCTVRNGASRGPQRRFWVKQHPISNPSIPSRAGSLFTGAGKQRNPFLVRVSRGWNRSLDNTRLQRWTLWRMILGEKYMWGVLLMALTEQLFSLSLSVGCWERDRWRRRS